MNNYQFCARWVLNQKGDKSVRVLDYGCGEGQIVKELRGFGVEAFGCDIFYEGGDYSRSVECELMSAGAIKRMDGGAIPFEDCSFDYVVNNQVMEHVEDLNHVLAEIRRVLKPQGIILSLFPDKGVWREGHCGVPFLHWFPRQSRVRVFYAVVLRVLGFGYHKGTKSAVRWSREFGDWLDRWTHYRTRQDIDATYGRYFYGLQHIEDYWLQLRLGRRSHWIAWLPSSVQKLFVQKMAGLVFVARRVS